MKTITLLLLPMLLVGADPEFNKDGELVRPKNYREWIFLSSGVGMNYGTGGLPFGNVFVEPSAYRKFVETGKWPDKSIFALEVRQPATEGSINKGGQYQTNLLALEAAVKDTARFYTHHIYRIRGMYLMIAAIIFKKTMFGFIHILNLPLIIISDGS